MIVENKTETLEDISCKQAARLMSVRRDRLLSAFEQVALTEHLQVCRNCQRFDSQLDFLSALAKRYAVGEKSDQ